MSTSVANPKIDLLKNIKKLSNKERIAKEKAEHFISYLPLDVHRESGLSVKNNEDNFDKEARQVTIDINADDDEGMHRNQKKRVWYNF